MQKENIRPALQPTQSPIQWVSEVIIPWQGTGGGNGRSIMSTIL